MPKLLSALGPWFSVCALLSLAAAAWSLREALRGHALRSARFAHGACTGAALVFWAALARGGLPHVELVHVGPISTLEVTLLCVAGAWLLVGTLLWAVGRRDQPWTLERIAYWLCFTLLAGLALNVVRERPAFGDVDDYVLAAEQLTRGEPLHPRYLYPPLLATLLSPLVAYGRDAVFLVCLGGNLLSLMLLFELLRRALVRYGFAPLAAVLLSFSALCANVAVLRTLFYVQINMHMANLMLLTLLWYPARPLASAFALALAAHLKTSPLMLALPFALSFDLRWLGWFALSLGGLVALTSYANDFAYYADYLYNVAHIYRANGIAYRENSLDSLLRATLLVFGQDLARAKVPLLILRALLFFFGLWLCQRAVRGRTFSTATVEGAAEELRTARVLDSFPILMLLLTTLSPLVWEHHPVLMLLPMLVLLKQLDREADLVIWLLAWCSIFLLPTFDVYPFSYRITLGAGLVYWLFARLVRREPGEGRYFRRAQAALSRWVAPA